jgi:hypothetical protein
MNMRLVVCGLAVWAGATLVLRMAGQRLLHPDNWSGTLILFAVSFPLTAWLVRRLCRRFRLRRDQWPAGAVSILLPFFPAVFPNMAPEVAGVFGGWMLWCCAGALVGVTVGRDKPS